MNRIAAAAACLLLIAIAAPAFAQPTAQFWEELGGSASGDGLSASTAGVPTGNRQVSVALGPDGTPVVAYADGDTIRVRRWDGTAWTLIGPSGASGGQPQIVTDASGRMYLAWRQFVGSTGSWEIFLLARDWAGTTWTELGGSGSGGGISGHEGGAGVPVFSLALGPDGTPYLAYQSTTFTETDFTTQNAGLHAWTNQVYVRRWDGTAWPFLGSGREGGGASNALSFNVSGHGTTTFVSHNGEHPTLAVGPDGVPVVAFIYSSFFEGGNPPEFNGENDDIYAVRWNGTAWQAMGPALPTTLDNVALGGPGGISNSLGWIREVGHDRLVRPSIMVDRNGMVVLAWGETNADDGFRYIYVYKFTGTAWTGLASPSGQVDKIAFAYDTSLAQGVKGPILAWPRGGGDISSVFVLEYDPGDGRWLEVGAGSATDLGISGPGQGGFNPRVTTTSAGIPTVAWIDTTPSVPQAFLRRYNEQTLPDFSVSSVSAPATTTPGASFTTTAVVRNGGNAAAPASTVNFYLAAGTTRGSGDVALGSRDVPILAAGGSASLDLTVTVPASTGPGTWHILAVVDEAAAVAELNESNNTTASSAMTIGAPPAPDLDITALSAPASVQAGGALAVQNTVANIGTAAAGAITVRFYLSSDDVLDAGDTALGTRTLGGLAAGASSAVTTTLTVPATTAPAAYHVIAVASIDAGGDSNPANDGAVSSTVNVTPADSPNLPDLTVSAITVPSSALAGRPLAINHTVSNTGSAAAGAFTVRFYLSTDATLDAGDTLLGSRTLTGLAAGASDSMVSTVTIPSTLAVPNTYRVLVVADALNQVTERDETNNVGVSTALSVTAVLPDLTVTTLTIPATGATGRPLAITNTVKNIGAATAGASTVRFYLSSDAALDAGDVLLGSRAVGMLPPGASSAAVTTLTIPADTSAPASYFVIAVADALGQVTETDETNNTAASAAAVAVALYRPDLTMTAVSVPATGATGRPLAISNTVKNAGPAPAGPFAVRFYLSSDDALDAGDVLLGARMLGGLAAGASSVAVTTLTIPANTSAPASYHVIAVADALGQQVETDETNNTLASSAVAISLYRPDLTLTTLTTPATGATGRPLAITNAVKNTGPAPAGPFTIRFYLSGDGTLDAGDVLLGSRMLGGLAAGATSSAVSTVTIPANTSAPATYQVIAVVDALDQQVELDESNNTAASAPFSVTLYRPDLSMTSMVMPAGGAVGRPASFRFTVANTGPAPSGVFTLRFYLSSDDVLDAGDVLLVTRTGGNLNPGASRTETATVMIPPDTAPGTYHVIAVLDPLGQMAEMDETNNVMVSAAMPITLYRPDLRLTSVSIPAAGAVGRPLAITNTVTNGGPAPAGPFTIRFYLSTDATLDASDVLLGTRMLGGLGAGASSTAVTTLTIPANTSAPASYQVIAVVDALEQQTELDETNNTLASSGSVQVSLYRPDLTITSLTAPANATAGHTLAITSTVKNTGPAPAGAFTVRFYLSSDETLDAGDVLLGSRMVGGLASGAMSTAVTTVTIPANTSVPSSYRLIGVVDALGQQAETDEGNNVTVSAPLSLTAFLPDLTIAVARLSGPVTAGRPLTIYETVRNVGPAPAAGPISVQFYLSADDTLDAGDVLLGAHTIPTVLAGATRVDARTYQVPAGTAVPSPYRVLAVITPAS